MKTRNSMFLVVLAFVFALGANARADTIVFHDDFQSDTAGTNPTAADLDPAIGTGDIGGSWIVTENNPTNVQVWNNTTPTSSTAGSNNYLRLNRVVYGNDGRVWAQGWTADTTGQIVTTNFSLWLGGSGSLYVGGYTNASYQGQSFGVAFGDTAFGDPQSNTVGYYDGSIERDSGLAIQRGAWQDVGVGIDLATHTLSVTVGNKTVSGLSTPLLAGNSAQICISCSNGSDHFIDNVAVGMVPEPSTLVLLTCGLLGLVAYAWRKRR